MTLQENCGQVFCVNFNPHGTVLASGYENGVIKLWNLDLENLLDHGCQWLQNYIKYNPNVKNEDRRLYDSYYTGR